MMVMIDTADVDSLMMMMVDMMGYYMMKMVGILMMMMMIMIMVTIVVEIDINFVLVIVVVAAVVVARLLTASFEVLSNYY